jgi:prophage antirepressor-like protein
VASSKIALPQCFTYQQHEVRCLGTDRAPWFIAKDVCEALGIVWKGSDTLQAIPDAWKGVRKLRTHVHNPDGTLSLRLQDVIVINEAAVYKLAFRSNKAAADDFTNWVASEVLPSIRKTGEYQAKQARRYQALGKTEDWIEERQEGIQERKSLTATIQAHEAKDYAGCTNAIYRPVLGGTAAGLKMTLQLRPKDNLRDNLSTRDLMKVKFAEMMASDKIEREDLRGDAPCHSACRLAGDAVASALRVVRETQL